MTDKPMTPDEALSILDAIASRQPMNRADHIAAQQAVTVLAAALHPPEHQNNGG